MKGSVYSSRASSPLHPSHHSYASPSSTPPHSHYNRNFSETIMEKNLDHAEFIIMKWDVDSQDKFIPFFFGDRSEARRFIEAVSGLRKAMHYFVNHNPSSDKLVRSQKLMQIGMKRLEKEFYVILSSNRKNLDSESVSGLSSRSSISEFYEDEVSEEDDESNSMINSTPPRSPIRSPIRSPNREMDMAMMDLKSIADCMIESGYSRECINIYKLIRKSIIDETLYYLGVEKLLNHSQMQKMEWNVLEMKIKSWLRAVKVGIKTLFHGERILCDIVFSSSEKIAESSFTEISREAAISLFNFPEKLTKSKKIISPEKMFRVLDMYEAISDMWPEIESIFSHESLSAVKSAAVTALVKLGESVRIMLTQFEAAIQKDSSKSPSGGGVHPLTRYVMNFLVFLGDYSGPISDILADWPVTVNTPLPEAYFSSPTSGGGEDPSAPAITTRIAWLILVLLCKLDGKAADYNDVALSYLFLANNLNYVVSKTRNSALGLLMGPDWIWKHGSKVNQYISNYERMGWSEVMSSLPENPTADISPQEVTERFRKFNFGFESAYKKQSSWVIPDPKLRDEVKISLAKKIFSGYRGFYQNQRGNYVREAGVAPIIRYAPEDLNNYLSDLFFASTASGGSTTTSRETSSSMSSRGR